MKIICTVPLALLLLSSVSAFAAPILARVIESKGSVSGGNGGAALEAGASHPAGTTLTTGSASRISMISFPGSVVTYAADTEVTIQHLDVERTSNATTRTAKFRLQEGTLFFAIDKVNWDTTTFEVLVPTGKASAKRPEPPKTATAGVATVRKGKLHVVAQAGRLDYTLPSGQSIAGHVGSVLTGDAGNLQVVNLSTGQVALYDSAGVATGSRAATPSELKAASEVFASAVELTETLIAAGTISSSIATAISETVAAVNQGLVSLGAEPLLTAQVGSLPSSSSSASLPAFSGSLGAGAANPANTSGGVRSPEQ
jgi:hypothetical protein